MWILITFAIIALVLFSGMILLKIEPLVSIVISVLTALIVAYFIHHLNITYTEHDRYRQKSGSTGSTGSTGSGPSTSVSTNMNTHLNTNVPTTSIQSSNSNTNANSSSFGFFQAGK